MIICNVDESGRVLTMSYAGHIAADEMRRCLGTVRDLMAQLEPDFFLLTDLSNLESMEAECAPELGAIMDLCSEKGMQKIVRVIPDPTKDIGFNLLSTFHHMPPVSTQTHQSLAEAIQQLLPQKSSEDQDPERREAHFTTAAHKEAEVNEGGLTDPAR